MRRCSICINPEREAIEKAIVEGQSYRRIATYFNCSAEAIRRHINNGHVSADLLKNSKLSEIKREKSVTDQVKLLCNRGYKLLDKAEKIDIRAEISAFRELREIFQLLGKLTGELQAASIHISQSQSQVALNAEKKVIFERFFATESMRYLESHFSKAAVGLVEHLEKIYYAEKENEETVDKNVKKKFEDLKKKNG